MNKRVESRDSTVFSDARSKRSTIKTGRAAPMGQPDVAERPPADFSASAGIKNQSDHLKEIDSTSSRGLRKCTWVWQWPGYRASTNQQRDKESAQRGFFNRFPVDDHAAG